MGLDQPETSRRRSRSMGDGDATHGATPPVESHPDGEDLVPANTTSPARNSQAFPSNIYSKSSGETVGLDSSIHDNPARAKPSAGPDASGCGFTLQHPLVLPPAPCHGLCEFNSVGGWTNMHSREPRTCACECKVQSPLHPRCTGLCTLQ